MRSRLTSMLRAIVTGLCIVASISTGPVRAALIAGWDFQTTSNGGTAVLASPNTPTTLVANFGSGSLYLNGSNGSSSWSTTELSAFAGTAVNATNGLSTTTTSPAALALVYQGSNNKQAMFGFSMTGYSDLVISLAAQRTSTGFTTQTWEYSTDGLSFSPIGTLSAGSTAGTLSSAFATSGTLSFGSISGLNNVATAYVRVTFAGATANGGNNRIDNIQFNASTYIPPSGTATWTGTGGGGTWQNGATGGFASPYANSLTDAVVFAGTGETVTLSGVLQAGSLLFQPTSGDYALNGGTSLQLGTGGNVSVAAGSTASIASALIGTSGFNKLGSGAAILSGVNSFTGGVSISQGTLQIGSDGALGDAANDVAVGGTLKTVSDLTLGSGRDLTGSGTLDIAPGTTLTVNGGAGMSAVTLPNAGTLDLQGATRSVGVLTFGAPSVVNASGAISSSGITATAVTSGTAVINPAITFSSGDKTVDVGSGGTLLLAGDIAGTTGRIAKTGAGTLIATGTNTTSGYRVGAAGATPTPGGTVILSNALASGTGQLQLNYGTLKTTVPGGLSFANGISVGGRTGAVGVLGGTEPMTFSGTSSFFRGTATSGELRLDVNNVSTLAGPFAATSGGGSATGITLGGAGTLVLAGDAALLTEAITLQDTLHLLVNNNLGGGVTVANGTLLGGSGSIAGAVTVAAGGILSPGTSPNTLTITNTLALADTSVLPFELNAADQTVGGGINDLVTGVTNLTLDGILNVTGIGDFTSIVAPVSWRLFNYSGTLTDNSVTLGSMPTLAPGQSYVIDTSTANQVNLVVVPEPAVCASVVSGLAVLLMLRRRRYAG